MNLGAIYESQGKLSEALDSYREEARLRPANVEAHVAVGDILTLQRAYPEAAKSYRQALALAPQDVEIQVALARSLQQSGDNKAASEQFMELYRQTLDAGALPAFATAS